MDKCHLADIDTFGSSRQLILKKTDIILEARGYSIFVCRCKECNQPFLGVAIEPRTIRAGECHNYWVPVSDREIQEIKMDPELGIELFKTRKHITWHSNGKITWSEGTEPALEMIFSDN